jgi:hypothetical protein
VASVVFLIANSFWNFFYFGIVVVKYGYVSKECPRCRLSFEGIKLNGKYIFSRFLTSYVNISGELY